MPNQSLPIWSKFQEILETLDEYQVVIVVAETGAGKSTQVPQMLFMDDFRLVVTQPRRLAARSVAARVAEEVGCPLGDIVGYRTAFEQRCSRNTEVLFCTDGLELVRELHAEWRPQVLVIDEVHEWNLNIETLVAYAKARLAKDPDFRVVIMSATMESGKLSAYFGNAPVINVEGRTFPVEERKPISGDPMLEAAALSREGRNVLVFQPGKSEIYQMIRDFDGLRLSAKILPLHGELEPEEQDQVFAHYSQGKIIIATNVAQTSITIDDIDAVVDSGLEKRIETLDGVEGLYLKRTSRADDLQRMGRAGRCKPGVYVNCYGGYEDQPEFPKPEIQRMRLDQLVLRLAIAGFDATQLEFFHQPDPETLRDAKRQLFVLGAMDESGQVTPLGAEMAKLPVAVEFARMIVEAKKLDVLGDVIAIVSCAEVGGIHDRKGFPAHLSGEQRSDFLAQLDLFQKASKMGGADALRENGINPKNFFRAREIRNKLGAQLNVQSIGDRETVLRACLAGMVGHLYRIGFSGYHNSKPSQGIRRMDNRSVTRCSWPEWLVGLPMNINHNRLLSMVSVADPKMLMEMAPHLVRRYNHDFRLAGLNENPELDSVTFDHVTTFNDLEIDRIPMTVSWNELPRRLPAGKTVEDIKSEIVIREVALEVLSERILPRRALEAPKKEEPIISGPWTRMDNRWWKCPKGHSDRAPKNVGDSMRCIFCDRTYQLAK